MKQSEIKLNVELNENHIPSKLQWEAPDSGTNGKQDCKAFMLAIWDSQEKGLMRIDLWNQEMQVDEMRDFCFQNLMTMADTLERATSDVELAHELRELGQKFAAKAQEIAAQNDAQ